MHWNISSQHDNDNLHDFHAHASLSRVIILTSHMNVISLERVVALISAWWRCCFTTWHHQTPLNFMFLQVFINNLFNLKMLHSILCEFPSFLVCKIRKINFSLATLIWWSWSWGDMKCSYFHQFDYNWMWKRAVKEEFCDHRNFSD